MNRPIDFQQTEAEALDTCCSPARLARLLAALSHPARIDILRHLSGVETCCCKDVVCRLDLAQSTVSQHLKVLHDAGLVHMQPRGRHSCYSVDRQALVELSTVFSELLKACVAGAPSR